MKIINFIQKHKILFSTVGILIGIVLVMWYSARGCRLEYNSFQPINEPKMPEMAQYTRPEEASYLTYSEWNLVYLPQDYGAFIQTQQPSGFPYFSSIKQFWSGYCNVYGITATQYPFNSDSHLMLSVIGFSSSIEFIIKGVYENTIGRVSEWMSFGNRTSEDDFAAQVAVEYGNFIPTDPWYMFPFGQKLARLWTDNDFFGPHFIRKIERKIFLSVEYGGKALYALVIKLGTRLVYGLPDADVYVAAIHVSDGAIATPRVKKVGDIDSETIILTVPHYQGFTDTIPSLAEKGVDFINIAGNDEILATAIVPSDWNGVSGNVNVLFTMPILTRPGLQRVALQVPILDLASFIRSLKSQGVTIEHLYDY